MKPIRETYDNPATQGRVMPATTGNYFTHFEIQSVREYQEPDGTRFFEPCQEDEDMEEDHPSGNAAGPVLCGVYGRLNVGGVEHIADYLKLEDARELLARIGCKV